MGPRIGLRKLAVLTLNIYQTINGGHLFSLHLCLSPNANKNLYQPPSHICMCNSLKCCFDTLYCKIIELAYELAIAM